MAQEALKSSDRRRPLFLRFLRFLRSYVLHISHSSAQLRSCLLRGPEAAPGVARSAYIVQIQTCPKFSQRQRYNFGFRFAGSDASARLLAPPHQIGRIGRVGRPVGPTLQTFLS